MAVNSFTSNQGTQTPILTDNTGGTAGTVIPIMKISLDAQGTFSSVWNGNTPGGTLGSIIGIGSISGLSNIPGGTLNNLGSLTGVGTITNIGVINNAGTIQALPNLPGGTLNSAGTVTGVGVVSVLSKGTISLGSVGGIDANAAAQTANPIGIGGTDSGGTIRTLLINSAGAANIGTLNNGTMVMSSGTLTTIPNIPGGTINILAGGTLGILTNGTLSSSGTTTGVGSVSSLGSLGMLNAGTISMLNAGTLTTIPNIPGGTINILAGGTLGILTNGTLSSSGTTTGVGTMTNLGSVTNLGQVYNAGTIQNILGGTVQTSPIPTIGQSTYGTHGTTGVSVAGTLAGGTGSGAGTEIFITSLSLTIPSTGGSQDASIGWGSNGGTFQAGTGLLVRGNFPPGGGIQKTFSPAINSGTNAQLILFQAGAGTVDVSVTYFITASTL